MGWGRRVPPRCHNANPFVPLNKQLQPYNKAGNEEGGIPAADILSMVASSMAASSEGLASHADVLREVFADKVEQDRVNTQTLAKALTRLEVRLTERLLLLLLLRKCYPFVL